ncbi:MAG: M10 family metallopeptidase C-terminal domain-containing protein [Geminicoccaceae bacterium]
MAYLTVTTQADVVNPGDGKLSLREAVAQANTSASADTIRFVTSLAGKTLVLTGGELVVNQDLTIDGAGQGVTLSGGGTQRLLRTSGSGTDLSVRGLTLASGFVQDRDGGAVFIGGGSLSVANSTIRDSQANGPQYSKPGSGGGIFAASGSRVTIADSELSWNHASYNGGAIAGGSNVILTIRGSILSHNDMDLFLGGAVYLDNGSSLVVESSTVTHNGGGEYSVGGAFALDGANGSISRSTISENNAGGAAGIWSNSLLTVSDSTIAKNDSAYGDFGTINGNVVFFRNSVITGNNAVFPIDSVGNLGIVAKQLFISNSIAAGNCLGSDHSTGCPTPDIKTSNLLVSNGHNVFGSNVSGSVAGDRQQVAANAIFAAVDPGNGGGTLSPTGIVPLKNATTNPALSGADPLTASRFGQLGTTARPLPAGSLADIGSIEINQPLSASPTINNDVITGNDATNNLSGLAGNDLIKGLGGTDTLNGGDGGDVLDGGPGNDVLNGGTGVDVATFAGTAAVVVDLSATPSTAKRGGETDTLTSIEGAIGSNGADTFKGDAQANEFQGGLGKDIYTGGAGRDTYDFNAAAESPVGTGRDVIQDFVPGQDALDIAGIDADSTTPGQQSFRWVGKATLTGAAQLGYYLSGGNTIVRASNDADAAPEIEIQLTGVKTLTPADFRF